MKENIIAVMFFTVFFLAVLFGAKVYFSGFHLTDDFKTLNIISGFREQPFFKEMAKQISENTSRRFNPLNSVQYVVRAKLFGDNFSLWFLSQIFIFVPTCFFLYGFARKIGATFWQSVFFPFFTLLGQQMLTWWMLCTAEPIAMFFVSLAMYLMAKASQREGDILSVTGFVVSIALSTLCKESFILFIPAAVVMWWALLCYGKMKPDMANIFFKALLPSVTLLIVMLFDLWVILYVVKTTTEGYNGIDGQMPLIGLLKDPHMFLMRLKVDIWVLLDMYTFGVILFGIFLIMNALSEKKDEFLRIIRKMSLFGFVFAMIFIPQVILYDKSGMQTRYWLPAFLAFSIAAVYLLKTISKSKEISFFGKRVFLVLIIIAFIPRVEHAVSRAKDFASEGLATRDLFRAVLSGDIHDPKILVVGDPIVNYEWSVALVKYFSFYGDVKKISFFEVGTDRGAELRPDFVEMVSKSFREVFGNNTVKTVNKGDYDFIIIMPNAESGFAPVARNADIFAQYKRSGYFWGRGEFVLYSRTVK